MPNTLPKATRPVRDPDSPSRRAASDDVFDDLGSLVREQMPGMRVLNVAPAAPARLDRDVERLDTSRSRPSPQAAVNARRSHGRDTENQPAADKVRLPDGQPATYFVSVEPEGLEDEDPAIRTAAQRHIPVVGRRVVALPDSPRIAEDEAETSNPAFWKPVSS